GRAVRQPLRRTYPRDAAGRVALAVGERLPASRVGCVPTLAGSPGAVEQERVGGAANEGSDCRQSHAAARAAYSSLSAAGLRHLSGKSAPCAQIRFCSLELGRGKLRPRGRLLRSDSQRPGLPFGLRGCVLGFARVVGELRRGRAKLADPFARSPAELVAAGALLHRLERAEADRAEFVGEPAGGE